MQLRAASYHFFRPPTQRRCYPLSEPHRHVETGCSSFLWETPHGKLDRCTYPFTPHSAECLMCLSDPARASSYESHSMSCNDCSVKRATCSTLTSPPRPPRAAGTTCASIARGYSLSTYVDACVGYFLIMVTGTPISKMTPAAQSTPQRDI